MLAEPVIDLCQRPGFQDTGRRSHWIAISRLHLGVGSTTNKRARNYIDQMPLLVVSSKIPNNQERGV